MRAALGLRETLSVPKSPAVTTFTCVTFTSAVAVCHAESWQSGGDQVGVREGDALIWTDVAQCTMYSTVCRLLLSSMFGSFQKFTS